MLIVIARKAAPPHSFRGRAHEPGLQEGRRAFASVHSEGFGLRNNFAASCTAKINARSLRQAFRMALDRTLILQVTGSLWDFFQHSQQRHKRSTRFARDLHMMHL